jgi:alcohol dehydrogenase
VKALFFDRELTLQDVPKPTPPPGEALVKVSMVGICGTDLEITRGYMDFRGIPGHEFVGIVESSPDGAGIGTRVVGEVNAGCGRCPQCAAGMERHCLDRTVLGIVGRNGALAEYLTLPVANLVPVPETLTDDKAVFTEPVAAAAEILEQVLVRPADRVLVIGDGRLGLLVSMVLRLTGCDLTLVGKHRSKLDIFARLGGSVEELQSFSITDQRFDMVVEASGNPSGWDLAVRSVKPRGTLVLKSTYHGAVEFNPAPLVIDEVTVVGSRCGRFAPALRLMELGLVDPIPLISAVVSLEQAKDVIERPDATAGLKILVKM